MTTSQPDSSIDSVAPVLPGAAVGVVGGGQLGRYFVLEARRLGYVTWVLDPDATAPAMQVAEHVIVAAYDDEGALAKLSAACNAVTIEFENVPAKSLQQLAKNTRVAPSRRAVSIAQDRDIEKRTAREFGLQTAPYALIESLHDIEKAVAAITLPGILKTSRLGYDGKGQRTCHSTEEVASAFTELGKVTCVLEQRIDLAQELSVVLARGADGHCLCFPVAENVHTNGILDTTIVPANAAQQLLNRAEKMATQFADGLDYQGVLAIEFFVDGAGELLFNEMAPRPHNSGHYTLDATITSQFEQQLRALCALPLGSVELLTPVCMLNLLGDSWPVDGVPDWLQIIGASGAHLHLYGKHEARPGRKMGHINCLSADAEGASKLAQRIKTALS